jgi:hypothetical protein
LHRCRQRHGVSHLPDVGGDANGIKHRLSKPNHPWTKGQVKRRNRTITDASVKRFPSESHDRLRAHLAPRQRFLNRWRTTGSILAASIFARRRKTLSGLTPGSRPINPRIRTPRTVIRSAAFLKCRPVVPAQSSCNGHLPRAAILPLMRRETDPPGRFPVRLPSENPHVPAVRNRLSTASTRQIDTVTR